MKDGVYEMKRSRKLRDIEKTYPTAEVIPYQILI